MNNKNIYLKYFSKFENVGDKFSFFLASKLFPKREIHTLNEDEYPNTNVILLGSILHWADKQSLICGAGLIKQGLTLKHQPKEIFCIRGPLTYKNLSKSGISCNDIFSDPGVMAPTFFTEKIKKKYKVGIIPHYVDLKNPWIDKQKSTDIKVTSVFEPLNNFFEQIKSCETILSSSLHGVIFAHAFGIPALWIELSDNVIGDGFKFYDYYYSLDLKTNDVERIKIKGNENAIELSNKAYYLNQRKLKENFILATEKLKRML